MCVGALLTLLAILACCNECNGVRKSWVKTWDLDDLKNWMGRKLPCGGKSASLPRRPTIPVFLGNRLTTSSLDLPVDGELIFGNGANLILDDTIEEDCQEATWSHQGHDSWWDPDAWHYPHFDDPPHSPVPHIHRVPCTRDDISFVSPNLSLYSVHISPPPVTISSLTIGNKEYTTSQLASYARSEEGGFRFVGVSSRIDSALLYVERPEECNDITGCLCGTEGASLKICEIMKTKCPYADCENPIKMKGFCCEVCGAEVIISHNGSLPLASVTNLLEDHLRTQVATNLNGHASKMTDDFYHVFFTPMNNEGDYKAASEAFKKKFEQELSNRGQHVSSLSFSGIANAKGRKGPSPHSVAAAFITLTICLAIGLAVYYMKKRRVTSQLSFMFRRLESNSRRVSVVSDVGGRRFSTTSSVLSPSYSREGGLRFHNPIFNQSMASLVGAGISGGHPISEAVPEDQEEGEHENPMYNAYEKMSPEERQASEDTLQAKEKSDMLTSTSSSSKQDISSYDTSISELDVIIEENHSNDENKNSKAESDGKETTNKAQQNDITWDISVEDKVPNTEDEFRSTVNIEPLLDINLPTTETEVAPVHSDESQRSSEGLLDDEQLKAEIEGKQDPIDDGDVSLASSNGNVDTTLNIEGFVPMQDLNFQE